LLVGEQKKYFVRRQRSAPHLLKGEHKAEKKRITEVPIFECPYSWRTGEQKKPILLPYHFG